MYKYKLISTKNENFDSLILREYTNKKYLQSLHRLNRSLMCVFDKKQDSI